MLDRDLSPRTKRLAEIQRELEALADADAKETRVRVSNIRALLQLLVNEQRLALGQRAAR